MSLGATECLQASSSRKQQCGWYHHRTLTTICTSAFGINSSVKFYCRVNVGILLLRTLLPWPYLVLDIIPNLHYQTSCNYLAKLILIRRCLNLPAPDWFMVSYLPIVTDTSCLDVTYISVELFVYYAKCITSIIFLLNPLSGFISGKYSSNFCACNKGSFLMIY